MDRHIFLVGMPGSGKSALGRRVASKLQIPYLDTDVYLTETTGMDTAQLYQYFGEQAFRDGETRLLQNLAGAVPGMSFFGGSPLPSALRCRAPLLSSGMRMPGYAEIIQLAQTQPYEAPEGGIPAAEKAQHRDAPGGARREARFPVRPAGQPVCPVRGASRRPARSLRFICGAKFTSGQDL